MEDLVARHLDLVSDPFDPYDPSYLFAHYAVEVGVDLLLRYDDPFLGVKLLEANLLRSWRDRQLLVRVFVKKEGRTDWVTLYTAELALRNLLGQYAMALASPNPLNAMAELGAKLAEEMGMEAITPEEVQDILKDAMDICCNDYRHAIVKTIKKVRRNIKAGIP